MFPVKSKPSLEISRRNFFRLSIGGVAAAAAVRAWPYRVYSFPREIVVPTRQPVWDEQFLRLWIEAMKIPRKKGFGVVHPTVEMSEAPCGRYSELRQALLLGKSFSLA